MSSPNLALAERIWERVFNFRMKSQGTDFAKQADIATKVMRHVMIDAIAEVLDEEMPTHAQAETNRTT